METTRPNFLVILLDDVGFASSSTFGGVADTPTLDALADQGLRYTRFHTTAICSPTRASLLTGRDPHVTGVGTVLNSAFDHPAYAGVIRDETATIARVLQDAGYATGAFGKWHLTPSWECTQAGPFDRWPTGRGFDHFYGFLGGETHQFEPTLFRGTTPITVPDDPDYHLTNDLADRTIDWIRSQTSTKPDRPFFAYLAPGATHAPLHVPLQWADKYRGRFDQGWDAIREEILQRQIDTGTVPTGTRLTPRPDEIPAWDTLSADERTVASRLMEIYAGFLEHTDVQIGRIMDELKRLELFDNTVVIYVVGDNGSSAEGGLPGTINHIGALQGHQESLEVQLAALERMGTRDSYAQYPAGWAWAMCTPLPWMKQVASHLGGTRNPMVVSWPAGISQPGTRTQFGHVNDIVPTLLDIAGVALPDAVDGVAQQPLNGVSLRPTFAAPEADEVHRQQYFEVFGHRALYRDGWLASAHHGGVPWAFLTNPIEGSFDEDVWELFDLTSDYSQSTDVAAEHPELLDELKSVFQAEAERVGIWPLQDARVQVPGLPYLCEGRTTFRYYPGTVGAPETQAPKLTGRSWHARCQVVVDSPQTQGVIFKVGARQAGLSLWLRDGAVPVFDYHTFDIDRITLTGQPLTPGEHLIEVNHRYLGPGKACPADLSIVVDGEVVAEGRISETATRSFQPSATFDIGETYGSPVGDHPASYPFRNGTLRQVEFELDT